MAVPAELIVDSWEIQQNDTQELIWAMRSLNHRADQCTTQAKYGRKSYVQWERKNDYESIISPHN